MADVPYGEVNWVCNLRSAGHATITVGRRKEEVTAVELGATEAIAFYRDVPGPRVQRTWVGAWIVRNIDQVDLDLDPSIRVRVNLIIP